MRTSIVIAIVVCSTATAHAAQDQRGTLHVDVRAADKPLPGAEVLAGSVKYRTDAGITIRAGGVTAPP